MGIKEFHKPQIKILYNGVDKTNQINWQNISIQDYEGQQADTINITIAWDNTRVRPKDKISIYCDGNFLGIFTITAIKIDYKKSYTIEGVSGDFMSNFIVKKNRSFQKKTYKQIIEQIAKENNYKVKLDFEYKNKQVTLTQHNKSDLNICQEISQSLELTFTIKNETLIFYDRDKTKNRVEYFYNADDCISLKYEKKQSVIYGSCEVFYQDTKAGKKANVKIGKEEPLLKLTALHKNKEEALKTAKQRLKKQNNSYITGEMSIVGVPFFAGGYLNLKFPNKTKKIIISKIQHNISDNWLSNISFFEAVSK